MTSTLRSKLIWPGVNVFVTAHTHLGNRLSHHLIPHEGDFCIVRPMSSGKTTLRSLCHLLTRSLRLLYRSPILHHLVTILDNTMERIMTTLLSEGSQSSWRPLTRDQLNDLMNPFRRADLQRGVYSLEVESAGASLSLADHMSALQSLYLRWRVAHSFTTTSELTFGQTKINSLSYLFVQCRA